MFSETGTRFIAELLQFMKTEETMTRNRIMLTFKSHLQTNSYFALSAD